jgi:hypothetical protein
MKTSIIIMFAYAAAIFADAQTTAFGKIKNPNTPVVTQEQDRAALSVISGFNAVWTAADSNEIVWRAQGDAQNKALALSVSNALAAKAASDTASLADTIARNHTNMLDYVNTLHEQTEQQNSAHANNTNNPHKVTCAQIGAASYISFTNEVKQREISFIEAKSHTDSATNGLAKSNNAHISNLFATGVMTWNGNPVMTNCISLWSADRSYCLAVSSGIVRVYSAIHGFHVECSENFWAANLNSPPWGTSFDLQTSGSTYLDGWEININDIPPGYAGYSYIKSDDGTIWQTNLYPAYFPWTMGLSPDWETSGASGTITIYETTILSEISAGATVHDLSTRLPTGGGVSTNLLLNSPLYRDSATNLTWKQTVSNGWVFITAYTNTP